MRIESVVTSISWIPSEAISGLSARLPFELGVAHYDNPPPDRIANLDELREADRFRFANQVRGWIEVEQGRVVGWGQEGGGLIGSTTLRLGRRQVVFQATALPDLRPEPRVSANQVVFTQTCGGRTGVPAPRRVRRAPFVQVVAPLAWTTLELTVRADGSSSHALVGASPFPRHWLYDSDGALASKSGLIDFSSWYTRAFGRHSPWGDVDSEALTTAVESALERELSLLVMRGETAPRIQKVRPGAVITEQGAVEDDLIMVLDGVVRVELNGERLTELGPGALLGERAILEGGIRTSTLRAVTDCKLARVPGDRIDREKLAEVSRSHRREDELG
ncbi:MAG TPA: cyclic nucleotide-binding domain-containing protein [Candidatus Dormibacteraeota bacterium]